MQMVVFHHSEESTDHIKLTTFKAPLLEWSSSLRGVTITIRRQGFIQAIAMSAQKIQSSNQVLKLAKSLKSLKSS